ncbi:MAG: adenylate/guanylate cyclase domain-containing protein [Thermoleophilia bacterium]|nr:adenylate/guanylate cyclase domain-containing protein [Thermoleophilia bacterium]
MNGRARKERKVVMVVFVDLVGFTARAESLDREDAEAILEPYHGRRRAELERRAGTVEKFIGDAIVAVFGAPVVHEDDAERAVRAAFEIRDWAAEDQHVEFRIAVSASPASGRASTRRVRRGCARTARQRVTAPQPSSCFTRSCAKSSFAASGARRSRTSCSARSGTYSSATSSTRRFPAPLGRPSTSTWLPGSTRSVVPRITPSCGPTTTRARSNMPKPGAARPASSPRARLALRDAGRQAVAPMAPHAAGSFLAAALELSPADDLERPRLMLELADKQERAIELGHKALAMAAEVGDDEFRTHGVRGSFARGAASSASALVERDFAREAEEAQPEGRAYEPPECEPELEPPLVRTVVESVALVSPSTHDVKRPGPLPLPTIAEMGAPAIEATVRLWAAQWLAEGRRAEADAELQPSLAFWHAVGAHRHVRQGERLLAAAS